MLMVNQLQQYASRVRPTPVFRLQKHKRRGPELIAPALSACYLFLFRPCCQSALNSSAKKNSSLIANGLKNGLKLLRLKFTFRLKTSFLLKTAFRLNLAFESTSAFSIFTTFSIFSVFLISTFLSPAAAFTLAANTNANPATNVARTVENLIKLFTISADAILI